MLNPSADREVNNNYRLSTEKARQWWASQGFESRKNIVIESDAVINDDELVEDQTVADIADQDYDELPDVTKQEVDAQIDDEEDIEEIFDVEGEEYLQCSTCDDMFTSNEDYEFHKSIDHGEEPEDFEESEETYQLTMHPELTRESLREANNLLTETEERQLYSGYDKNGDIQSSVMPYNVPSVATGKYNDNPNEFFYSNKIFRAGSSSLRTSSLGESKANEDGYTTKDDPAICPNCNSDSFGYIMNGQRYEFEDVQSNGKVKCDSCGGEFTPRELVTIADGYYTESKASEVDENEKDDIFQYLFDLQDSGATNMFGAGPYVEREFPHLDKKEVRDVVLEWMKNYEEIHARMGIESKASEVDEIKYDGYGNIDMEDGWSQGQWDELDADMDSMDKQDEKIKKWREQGLTDDEITVKLQNGESKASEKGEWDWLDKGADSKSVDYDKVKYEDDGVSDISIQNAEPKGADANEFLDNVSFGVESIDYVYPTKANETKDKSYVTESEPFEEEYEEFEDSDDEMIEETIAQRKLTGYNDDSIARELHINYGVSHEEALEKVYSIEVSTNDRVAQTFFGKMYKECTESEKDELRMYSGSD